MWLFPIERQRQWHARRLGIPNAVVSPVVTAETTHRNLSRECRGKSRLWEPSNDGTALIWSMGHAAQQQAATTVYPPVCSRGNDGERLLHLDFSRGNDTRRFLLAAPCRQLALQGLPAVMH
jgi:hypothetical protein